MPPMMHTGHEINETVEQAVGFENDISGQVEATPADKPADEAKPAPEAPKPEAAPKPEWDLKKQHADEIRAAQQREAALRTQSAQLDERNAKLGETVTSLQGDLTEIKTQLSSLKDREPDDEMDLDELDDFEGLQNALKTVTGKLAQQQERLTASTTKMTTASERLAAQQETIDKLQSQLEEVSTIARQEVGSKAVHAACEPLNTQYGAQFEDAAVETVDTRFIQLGMNRLEPNAQRKWILSELNSTYHRMAADAHASANIPAKGTVPPAISATTGGAAAPANVPLKEGSFEDVKAQLDSQARAPTRRLS